MSPLAAFRATYTDWKLVRTRSVVQIVFELPVEKADEAYATLGGMPQSGTEIWCAIARLNEGGANQETAQSPTETPKAAEPEPPKATPAQSLRNWRDLSYAQQAGVLCNDTAFWRFLEETQKAHCESAEHAADLVRKHCIVPSRRDIRDNHPSARLWREMASDFRSWMREPEVV